MDGALFAKLLSDKHLFELEHMEYGTAVHEKSWKSCVLSHKIEKACLSHRQARFYSSVFFFGHSLRTNGISKMPLCGFTQRHSKQPYKKWADGEPWLLREKLCVF